MTKPASSRRAPKKAARCRTCGRRIHVPVGWSTGPAVRRHYWKHHPEVMRPAEDGGGR